MYPSIVKVVPQEDFTLLIGFDNGEGGILDMKPHLGFGAFRKIADYENQVEALRSLLAERGMSEEEMEREIEKRSE